MLLSDIPECFQEALGIGSQEVVKFTQLSVKAFLHRDAFVFEDGETISIQDLVPGIKVWVLSLKGATERKPVREKLALVMAR
jgi:hypothetical protein